MPERRAAIRLEISNNAAENAIRPIALSGRIDCSPDLTPAASAPRSSTIFHTARLNGLEPEAYLRDLRTRIGEHPINRLDELLPWNIARSVMLAGGATLE